MSRTHVASCHFAAVLLLGSGCAGAADDGFDSLSGSPEGGDGGALEAGDDGSITDLGDEGETGVPEGYDCDFDAGCHLPHLPDPSVGLASDAPAGCGEGEFLLATTIDLGPLGSGMDAAKTIPLAVDVDGDEVLDLVVDARKLSAPMQLSGRGDGSFDPPVWLSGGGIFAGGWGVDAGDVTGDGLRDIVVGDHVMGAHVWTAPGLTHLSSGLPVGTFSGAGAADLDRDGMLDVVLGADQFAVGYAVALSTGSGFIASPAAGLPPYEQTDQLAGMPSNIGYLTFADMDGDDDLDLVAFGQVNVGVSAFIYRNEGGGAIWSPIATLSGGSAQWVGSPVQGSIGDVDCDGDIDVLTGGKVHLQVDEGFEVGWLINGADIGHFADMNGDGHLDVVTHDRTQGLDIHLGDGSGRGFVLAEVGLPASDETLESTYGVEVGDFNGNGSLDILRAYKTPSTTLVEVWVR